MDLLTSSQDTIVEIQVKKFDKKSSRILIIDLKGD